MIRLSVFYPASDDATFDHDYPPPDPTLPPLVAAPAGATVI